jgi:predicted nucleotidyltransferase
MPFSVSLKKISSIQNTRHTIAEFRIFGSYKYAETGIKILGIVVVFAGRFGHRFSPGYFRL